MTVETLTTIFGSIGGASLVSSILTFSLTKRKYNKETDSIEILNLKASVEVYRDIVIDLKKQQDWLKLEMKEMRIEFKKELAEARNSN